MSSRDVPREQMPLSRHHVSKMPDGYYSGDKPNPNLRAFVEQHIKERPYDPVTDKYNVTAFDKSIETTKATAIYNMHTYWSKKPHDAIRQYIRHYTQPGDLVLDLFCGSGGTELAALMEGRKAIAIDRSPAATFITKNYCTPVDVTELKAAFEELKHKVKPGIDWLYETRCDRCGGKATTAYTVYSQVFQCPRCMEKVPLFDCAQVEGMTAKGKAKKVNVCPHCHSRGVDEEIGTRSQKYGSVPVLVSYLCENGCKPARDERRHNDPDEKKREYFRRYDLGKLKEIDSKPIPHWYPPHRMMNVEDDSTPWGVKWRAGTSNFRTVAELFTKRNLWALAAIRESAESSILRDSLMFGLEATLINLSRMQGYSTDPRFPNNLFKGTYYIPQTGREYAVLPWYQGKIDNLIRGYGVANRAVENRGDLMVSTANSATPLDIASNSIDYIFTDPAYGDSVQYGELNFVWEAWLGFDTNWHDEEIVVNDVRGKTEANWANLMRKAMSECYRVLKPGRWLSLCYHDTSEGTWSLIQDIMAEAGFLADKTDTALFIDAKQKSYNQLTADKVTKRDLVINFRRPRPDEVASVIVVTGEDDLRSFSEKARAIIREYLEANPGLTKDRVYDHLVSRMVRAGTMEPHNFEELLRQVAEEVKEPVRKSLFENQPPNLFGTHEVGRWYVKEHEIAAIDAAETAKEDAAAQSVGTFMGKEMGRHLEAEGVHYSDIFEHFVFSVKDKPRRLLADWLPDYFYKTDEGTWRLPLTPEEEQTKAEGRARGISRQVKRYVSFLEQGISVPERERPTGATLADWIRHCKKSGLYQQGKLLYEKGGLNGESLDDVAQAGAEEDYQVCCRMLSRGEKTK